MVRISCFNCPLQKKKKIVPSALLFYCCFHWMVGYCAYIDAEHALDPAFAEALGVRTENMLLSQPDCGEHALGLVDILVRSGSVDVVVVDSVGTISFLFYLIIFWSCCIYITSQFLICS
jgi:RecA/RadA recombinase